MNPPRCVILGGGGHARVVIDALRESGAAKPVAIVDRDPARIGHEVDGVRIAGDDAQLGALRAEGVTHFVLGLAGAASTQPRRRVFDSAIAQGFIPLTLLHPRAIVSTAATIGDGCQIFAGAIVNAGATLGANVIVNTGAIVEHDCHVESHAHIASGACLCGGVHVEEGAHIGARSVVRQLVRIGANAIVAAGAAVVDDVAPGVTVAGIPARPLSASHA